MSGHLRPYSKDTLLFNPPEDPQDAAMCGAILDVMDEYGLDAIGLPPDQFPSAKRKRREAEARERAERIARETQERDKRDREMQELIDWLESLPAEQRAKVREKVKKAALMEDSNE